MPAPVPGTPGFMDRLLEALWLLWWEGWSFPGAQVWARTDVGLVVTYWLVNSVIKYAIADTEKAHSTLVAAIFTVLRAELCIKYSMARIKTRLTLASILLPHHSHYQGSGRLAFLSPGASTAGRRLGPGAHHPRIACCWVAEYADFRI